MVISVHLSSQKLKKHVFETILLLSADFGFREYFFLRNMLKSIGINEGSDIKSNKCIIEPSNLEKMSEKCYSTFFSII